MALYKQKKLQSNELVDRLNTCTGSTIIDEMELKRIQLAASKLIDEGQPHAVKASGYFILGALASLRIDRAEMNRCFKAAIACSDPDDRAVYRHNYVLASLRTYAIRQAAELCEQLAEDFPGDVDILGQTLLCADTVLNFDLAKSVRARLKALGQELEDDGVLNNDALPLRMASFGVSTEDLLARTDIAAELLAEHKVRSTGVHLYVSDSGESLYRFTVMVDPGKAAELNFEIADALASKFADPMETILSIGVRPYEENMQ